MNILGATKREEIRAITRLGFPVMVAQTASTSMTFIDTLMVSRLGNEQLAAAALGNSVFSPLMITSMGLLAATSPMVAQAYGARDYRSVGHAVRQGFLVAGVLALLAFLALVESPRLLHWMGQDFSTVELAGGYLGYLSWAAPPFLAFSVLRNLVEGVSSPRLVTLVTLIGAALNCTGNWILMFGKLGLPAMGLRGCGLATAITYWSMLAMLWLIVVFKSRFRDFELFLVRDNLDFSYLKELLRVGWPIAASQGLEVGLFAVTSMLMGLLSVEALAAHLIAIQCAAFTFMIALGLAIATSVRVGQNVGGGHRLRAVTAGWCGVLLVILFMSIPALAFLTLPQRIAGLFLNPAEVANLPVFRQAVQLLMLAAAFQIFDGVQVVSMGALRGFRDTRRPMILALIAYWFVGLPTGIVLAFPLNWGAKGLWTGLVMGLVSASLLLVDRLRRKALEINGG